MNPTEPDPNNLSDGAARRVENLARGRGTSRAERWFRSLVQNSSDIIAIYVDDGTVRYMSPSVERILGYKPEELVGTSAFIRVHPEDVELVSRSFAEALENSGVMPPVEFRSRAADGSWRYMETIFNNLLDDRDVGGIVANSRDITERKDAEEALKESEERYRMVVEQSAESMWLFDPHTKQVLESNTTFQEMLGYTADELRRMTNYDFVAHSRKDIDSAVERVVRERRGFFGERKYRRKDGTVLDVQVSGTVIPYRGREVVCSVARDLTERKEAEEEKSRQARHAALRADVSATLAEGGTVQGILQRCTESMVGHLDAAFARIWTLNEEENVLELQASAGLYNRLDGAYSQIPVGKYKIGLIAQERRPHLINDVVNDPRIHDKEWAKREGMVAFAGYPLAVEDRLVGVMAIFARQPLREDTIEALASVADAIAQGIKRKRVEEALKESEERYRAVMEQSVETIYLYDAETKRVLESNSAFQKLVGYTEEELLGMEIYDFIAHDKQNIDANIRRSLKERRRHIGERRYRRKDGSIIVVDTSASVISCHGRTALCAVSRDVTERKAAEEALKESEKRFRSLLQNASDVITILGADGTIQYDSPSIERVLGYRPEERVGKSGFDYVHPEDLGLAKRSFTEALDCSGVHSPVEFRLRHKDGSWRRMEVTRSNLLDDPAVRGVVANFHDITERKEAEEALRQSEERYRAVVEQTIEGIYLGAADTKRVLESNAAFQEMLGYTAEELRGMHIYEFVAHDHQNIDSVFQSVLDKGHHFIGERRYRRKDGSIVDVETSSTIISYDEREVLCTVVRDVTKRKEAEETLRKSEERFRALTQNSSDIITLLGAEGTIRYQSPSIERILGYRPEEMVGDDAFDYVHPEDLGRVEMAFVEGLKDPRRRPSAEYRFRHKNGSWRWLESIGTNLLDDPQVGEYVLNSRDVTDRRRAEEALKESEERFRGAFNDAPVGVALVGLDGGYLKVNRALCEMLGYSEQELLKKTTTEVTHPDDWEAGNEHTRRVLEGVVGRSYYLEKRYVHADGRTVWVLSSVSLVRDPQGNPSHFVSLYQDITERKALEEQLQHRALHDLLTDLPNRHLFVDRLDQALRRTRRKKGHQVAVLFMDLDDFKAINDSLGHEMGDLLLVDVAERLRRCLRPEDTLARFGGDEFVVLIEDVESPEDAVRVAERIVEGFRETFVVEGRELFLRASIGVALGTARQKSPEDLLRDADTAMYEAKEAGLGYTVFDPTMYERAVGRLEMENELRRAIEAEEFMVHYQPIMSLQTGEVREMEALVRWDHPERGLLDPWEFMAVAEQSGIVVPMGERVLKEACRQAKEWQEEHPRIHPLVMSVNLSARQLQRPDIAQIVERVLKKTGLEACYLRLDITETVYIKALEGNTRALDQLKRLGVCISIDDFGTGYSSLAYLKRLPANALKIDKSFVKGIGEDIEDTAIVGMVIELAHTLGMEAIAEGVESEAQATLLEEIGCDLAQGFHFSEPLPPETATRFLAEERTS